MAHGDAVVVVVVVVVVIVVVVVVVVPKIKKIRLYIISGFIKNDFRLDKKN